MRLLRSLVRLPSLLLAGVAGALLYSRFAVPHRLDLPSALDAARGQLDLPGFGALSYYTNFDTATQARPLLLLHSVNAAASSAEVRPLFEAYSRQRPVYALDLPGFGFSARPAANYQPELYAQAIARMLDHITQTHSGQAVDVVALSLTSEFAARIALSDSRVHSLALISPSGLGSPRPGTQTASAQCKANQVHRWLAFPLWAQALYDLIASRPSIRYFLQKSFVAEPDAGLLAYAYPTSHQSGARHAPLSFVSGQLFAQNALSELYQPLTLPVLVLYDQDAFVNFDLLPVFEAAPNVQSVRIRPSQGLPQFDQPAQTGAALQRFWQDQNEETPMLRR